MSIGRYGFSGSARVSNGAVDPLSAVNVLVHPDPTSQCNQPVEPLGLVLVTSAWANQTTPMDSAAPVAELSSLGRHRYVVEDVSPGLTELPPQSAGHAALVGEGDSSAFVENLRPGNRVVIRYSLSPDPSTVISAAGGGFILLSRGAINPEIAGITTAPDTAVTIAGTNTMGTEAVFAVFDGPPDGVGTGMSFAEMAGWLQAEGMANGMEFDGGGSSTLAARIPPSDVDTIVNAPADGSERQVAECLCFYHP